MSRIKAKAYQATANYEKKLSANWNAIDPVFSFVIKKKLILLAMGL